MGQLIHALVALLPVFLLGMVRAPEAGPLASSPAPSPCPDWCAEAHDGPLGDDEHAGRTRTHASAIDGREVDVQLRQEPGAGVRLALAVTVEAGHCETVETELDLQAAERLALDLLALVEAARGTTVERAERLARWNRMGQEGARLALSYIADRASALYRAAAEHGAREAGR